MWSHLFCSFRIYDPCANAHRMHFILRCKCKFVFVFFIFGIFPLFIFHFIAKLCNVAQFAAMEAHPYTLLQSSSLLWCNIMVVSSPWGSFSSRFDISCIKPAVAYSTVKSFISILSKVVIKYSYDVGKLLSKVMMMIPSSHICIFKHTSWSTNTLILVDVVE